MRNRKNGTSAIKRKSTRMIERYNLFFFDYKQLVLIYRL